MCQHGTIVTICILHVTVFSQRTSITKWARKSRVKFWLCFLWRRFRFRFSFCHPCVDNSRKEFENSNLDRLLRVLFGFGTKERVTLSEMTSLGLASRWHGEKKNYYYISRHKSSLPPPSPPFFSFPPKTTTTTIAVTHILVIPRIHDSKESEQKTKNPSCIIHVVCNEVFQLPCTICCSCKEIKKLYRKRFEGHVPPCVCS